MNNKIVRIVLLFAVIAAIGVFYFESSEISFLKYESINSWGLAHPHGPNKTDSNETDSNETDHYRNETIRNHWHEHKKKFKRNYTNDTDEDKAKFKCFLHHYNKVHSHKNPHYNVSLNEFSDHCPEDFKRTHHNAKFKNHTELPPLSPEIETNIVKLGATISTSISTSQNTQTFTSGGVTVKKIITTNVTNTTTYNGATTVILTVNVTTVLFSPSYSVSTVITVYCSGASCGGSSNSTTTNTTNNTSTNTTNNTSTNTTNNTANKTTNNTTNNTSSNTSLTNNTTPSTPSTAGSFWGGLPSPVPISLLSSLSTLTPPAYVDWRAIGKVSPVKNQLQCGSCWTFSTVGALEALNNINNSATNATSNFSEQQLVDCDSFDGGCNGGDPGSAMDWQYLNGVATETAYPYKSGDGYSRGTGSCSSLPNNAIKTYGAKRIKANDTNAVKVAVAMQPVVIGVNADNWSPYSGGIYTDCSMNIDHAVLLVGYTDQYWIIKNSWGTGWGDKGFIYVANSPLCNQMISASASFPLAKPRTEDENPSCRYYSSSYCTNPDYIPTMMEQCWVTCKF